MSIRAKPISNIVIRDEQNIYNILTNREKLECLFQEYEKYHQLDKEEKQLQVCYDENTPCVPNKEDEKVNYSIENKMVIVDASNYTNDNYSHKEENRHSKYPEEKDEKLDLEYMKPDLKSKIKEELEKSHREQLILLKEYKQTIIDFLLYNKDSIRVEDLKMSEPFYKCYREKGNCYICNSLSNIICINCNNYKEAWLCTNHWKQHEIEKHNRLNTR